MIEWIAENECTILRVAACVWVILACGGYVMLIALVRPNRGEK